MFKHFPTKMFTGGEGGAQRTSVDNSVDNSIDNSADTGANAGTSIGGGLATVFGGCTAI